MKKLIDLGDGYQKKKVRGSKKILRGSKKNYSTFTPVMLFTQSPGSSCGHFQHCVSTTHMKTSPSSFRPFGFHWSMKGAGAGDDLWPISPTIPFLAQASSQSEPVPSTQLETPSPVPSTQLETLSSPELACKHHEAHPLTCPASNVALGPASSPKRSGKHEFGVGHAFDLTQCLCVQQADHPSKVACSPEISSRHMCQVCHECLCLLPRVGNPCNVGTASAACSIVRELDTDCGSSNAVPAPVFVDSVRELPSEKRSPEQPELVVRSPRAHCSYRKKRAKVNQEPVASDFSRMVFFPKWVSKQVTDRQNPCQVAEATHGVHMEGGMLHANESQEVDALRTPEVGLEGMESVLLSLGVSRVLAREAASLHPNDINDWACSSLRRHRRPATADVINVDELPSSASLSGPPIPVSWLPSTGEPFAAESLPPHSLPASSSAARSMDPAPPLAQSFAAPGVLPACTVFRYHAS